MSTTAQEARAILKENFLRTLTQLTGKPAAICMLENTTVSATFQCSDGALDYILVSDLQTALGTYQNSVLRASDTVSVTFPNADLSDVSPYYRKFRENVTTKHES